MLLPHSLLPMELLYSCGVDEANWGAFYCSTALLGAMMGSYVAAGHLILGLCSSEASPLPPESHLLSPLLNLSIVFQTNN